MRRWRERYRRMSHPRGTFSCPRIHLGPPSDMTADTTPKWVWEPVNPLVAGTAGDIAKLFKNEVVKNPGILADGAPSDLATLLAREVIQNSADSARELQSDLADAPDFEIDFIFDSFEGVERARLASALDLASLASRVGEVQDESARAQLGLSTTDCLDQLALAAPLSTLQIVEHGTTGMYGPFRGAESKMYLALISLGYTAKAAGSGGSYGYGKAGLIRGSHIRTVIAYTCFRERSDDPGVTRRLLGMTYWGQHRAGGQSFTGFARLGHVGEGGVVPFENDLADAVAESLGIDLRNPSDDDSLGTTFLVVDPTITATDLVKAIERNWWPAIEHGALTTTVLDGSKRMVPRPRLDPVLNPFIEALDLALSQPDNLGAERKRSDFFKFTASDGNEYRLGSLGLVAESGGWSYEIEDPENDGVTQHRSLVALTRGPRMVVEYLETGTTRPFVRGTFVAHDDVDDLLRQTEPKAHDAWQTRIDEGGVDAAAPEAAKRILDRIKRNVNDFRRSLKPPPRPVEEIRLPELERLVMRLLDGKGRDQPPPSPGDRPFSINVDQHLIEAEQPLHIRLEGSVRVALAERDDLPEVAESLVTISLRVMEDGGIGEDLPLTVSIPDGFTSESDSPTVIRGEIGRDHVVVRYLSEPYRSDWTCKLKAEAVFAQPTEDRSPQ